MGILDLYGSNFAHISADPTVNICGGGNKLCIYQPKNRDMKIKDALEELKTKNPDTNNWIIYQSKSGHFADYPGSIKHAVVDGKCVKRGELTEERLIEIFRGILGIVVSEGGIEKLVASYDPQYCK